MKVILKSALFLFAISLYSNQGLAQGNTQIVDSSPKKVTIVSSLDLLGKLPKGTTNRIKKYRSIFDANKLPIFCKFEHQLSKKSKLNLRMRLGSLDYVNKLEGKN